MNDHIADANKMVSDTPRTDAAYAASTGAGIYELFKESQDIERELNAANSKIKRLEEAGDKIVEAGWSVQDWSGMCVVWAKAKGDKP